MPPLRTTVLIDASTATVIPVTAGEILSEHDIDPTTAYWRNNNKSPADGRTLNNDPTVQSTMTRIMHSGGG